MSACRFNANDIAFPWYYNNDVPIMQSMLRNVLKLSRVSQARAHSVPVNCYNEWDPLEEIIVGRLEGACVPSLSSEVKACLPGPKYAFFLERGGARYPLEYTKKAIAEVEHFCSVLEGEGVKVHRPDLVDFQVGYTTPNFSSPVGLYNAMPR